MKLIYIANARIPTEKANGIQVMEMCAAFNNKAELELVLPWRFNSTKGDPFEYYEIKKNFKIKKLPCIDLIPLDFILGNFSFWVQTISFLASVKIYLMFKKYDILYTRERFLGLFFKDFFLEIHSLPNKVKNIHKRIWNKAKKLIVITNFIKKELIDKGVNSNKILVAPDCVDIEKFNTNISKKEARKKLDISLDRKIVVYTGHLFKWKGADILVEAAGLLKDVLFIFVGGTKKDVSNFKNKFRNRKNILILGHRSHLEIPLYQKASDVLVLPNKKEEKISEFYTSPLKLFEYMVSQRPIVASDLSSTKEVLNEKNAILVNPNDPNCLAEGIEKVLQNQDLANKISQQAFLDVREYTWDKRAKKIL